ncbi:MAG: hypothetical protein M9887_01830 [Chitinophagales bacterium]|nr:hypothetical protein [Chitinophagales bacterium]
MFQKRTILILTTILSILFFLISCKKAESPYYIKYSYDNGETWSSTTANGFIQNDSLLLTGQKRKDGSNIVIFTNSDTPKTYRLALDGVDLTDLNSIDPNSLDMESIVVINPNGSKKGENNLVSLSGTLIIESIDTKGKKVEGSFNGRFVKGININNPKTIIGEFVVKYKKVGTFGI